MNKYYKIIESFLQNNEIARNNANFIYTLPVLEHIVSGKIFEDYFFDVICEGLPTKELHREGWVYQHQLYKLSPYCVGLSAESIAFHGLQSNAKNERKARPPKRLETLFMQCANLICLIAQEVSGATSLNDITTIAAGYLWYLETNNIKKYTYYELKNIWQEFLYNVNLPFRSGNSPFSNITLDFGKPNHRLQDKPIVYAGKLLDKTYREIPAEYYDRINETFIDAMYEGDANGNPFTFPLITINITDDFDRNNKVWKKLLEKSEYFGGFYVQNYLKEPFTKDTIYKRKNPFLRPFDEGMIYSNCCRMTFDISLVETVTGSNPFHSGSGIGGIGVFAINMNRLLYLAKTNENILFEMLDYLLDIASKTLQRKRNWLKKYWNDLFPYLSFYVPSDRSLYNIISIIGVHEGMINAGFKDGLFNDEAKDYAHKIAQHIYKRLEEFMHKDKCLYSLEYAPSENAACRLAQKDLKFAEKVKEYIRNNKEIKLSDVEQIDKLAKEAILKW